MASTPSIIVKSPNACATVLPRQAAPRPRSSLRHSAEIARSFAPRGRTEIGFGIFKKPRPLGSRGFAADSAGGDRKACPPVGRDLGDRPAVAVFGFAAVSGDALGEVQPSFGNS